MMQFSVYDKLRQTTVGVSFFLGFCGLSHAIDGVYEINQAAIDAAGGFPYHITVSGSYRLTGNLIQSERLNPSVGVGLINIDTNHVTLDLNGFTIYGLSDPGVVGVYSQANNVSVMSGTITGLDQGKQSGIILGDESLVEDIRSISNNAGIEVGDISIVRNSIVKDNFVLGISAGAGSTVNGNTVNDNGLGIAAGPGSNVLANTAYNNQGPGLVLTGAVGYGSNVLSDNNGGNANPQVVGGVEIGANLCGTTSLCP